MSDKNTEIVLSALAELDLEEIWHYTFKTWSLQQADDYQDILFNGMQSISNNISLIKIITLNNVNYYYYPIAHHIIFFHLNNHELFIIRILHKKMNFGLHL